MSSLIAYNGLDVVTPDPSGVGGLALNTNFKKLSTKITTSNPSATDDISHGYGIGSRWYNSSTATEWICTVDTTSAAVWNKIAANPFDQSLNTTNSPTFANATAGTVSGDGSKLTATGVERAGTTTNLPLILKPKGTGALQLDSAGNSRGSYAVDLQISRATSAEVASGNYSVISGGQNNTASGTVSHAEGYTSTASGYGSHSEGVGTTAAGNYGSHAEGHNCQANGSFGSHAEGELSTATAFASHAEGWTTTSSGKYGSHAEGWTTTASGQYGSHAEGFGTAATGDFGSHAEGWQTTASGYASHAEGSFSLAEKSCQHAHASGKFSSTGDAQYSRLVVRTSTTSATVTEMLILGSQHLVLANDTTWMFSVEVAARRTDADNESAAYKLEGCIDRNTNAASTSLVGTVTKTVIAEDTAAWDVNATADTTNGSLKIAVTGQASKTIYWVAVVNLVQVTG